MSSNSASLPPTDTHRTTVAPHTASLGLALSDGARLPERFRHGMFVGQHGSWNRKPLSGYKVIFVPFEGGRPSGKPEDILTGFLSEDGDAYGRPAGVAVDKSGALLVADDVGNAPETGGIPQAAAAELVNFPTTVQRCVPGKDGE